MEKETKQKMRSYLAGPRPVTLTQRNRIENILKKHKFNVYDPLKHERVTLRINKNAHGRHGGILKIDGYAIAKRNLALKRDKKLQAYLCGPMSDLTDSTYRDEMKRILKTHGYTWYDPAKLEQTIIKFDRRTRKRARDIVKRDEAAIRKGDMLISYFPVPSDGSAMELTYANHANILSIVIIPEHMETFSLYLLKADVVLVGFKALEKLLSDPKWIEKSLNKETINFSKKMYTRAMNIIKRNEIAIRKSDLQVGYFPRASIGAAMELAFAHHIFVPSIVLIPKERKNVSPFLFKGDQTFRDINGLDRFLGNPIKIKKLMSKYVKVV